LLAARCLAHETISTNLTWTREISRLVYKHCAGCHVAGGPAMSLMTYEEARPWAKAMRDEVLARRMPPWDAVKGVGDFRDDASLSQPEMDLLVAWVEGGAPEGDRVYLPSKPPVPDAPSRNEGTRSLELRHSMTLTGSLTLAAIEPNGALEVAAYLPDQSVERLIWVREFRPRWKRAYYFRRPVSLPKGTRLLLYSEAHAEARLLVSAGSPPAQ
jgi:hypothetical protein